MSKLDIIIDCDPGIDDAFCIGAASLHPEVHLKGITTCFGNSGINQVTANALKLLSFFGKDDIHVYKGAQEPSNNFADSSYVFGKDALGGFSSKIINTNKVHHWTAAEAIVKAAKSEQINTLVVIGPLTNLKEAIEIDKIAISRLKEIIVMGGTIYSHGNITPHAEFNFYCDPESAQYSLSELNNITLLPLDLTSKFILTPKMVEKIVDSKIRIMAENIMRFAFNYNLKNSIKGQALHDLLAFKYLVNPASFETKNMNIDVLTEGDEKGKVILNNKNITNKIKVVFACENLNPLKFLNSLVR